MAPAVVASLLVLLLVVAIVALIAHDSRRTLKALEDARARPDVDQRDRLPLHEVFVARLPVASREALAPGDARRTLPFTDAVALPVTTELPVDALARAAFEALGDPLPLDLRAEPCLVPAADAARAAQVLRRGLDERRADLARALARGEEDALADIEAALAGEPRTEAAPSAGLDVARLLPLLAERCAAAAERGESVALLLRHAGHREVLRVLQGAPPPSDPPRVWCLELQLFMTVDVEDDALLRRGFLTPSRSRPLPSARQILYLLLATIEGGQDALPLRPDPSERVFAVAPGDVPAVVATLERALAPGPAREAFVARLLELEREDAPENGGACADAARVNAALDAGALPPGEATAALEAASLLRPLLATARDAAAVRGGLMAVHRVCELVPALAA